MPARRPKLDVSAPLFAEAPDRGAPLAARMRPRTLDEFVGQPQLVGPDGALTRVVRPGHIPSMVLWGPPGSGKTTLARLLAERAGGSWRRAVANGQLLGKRWKANRGLATAEPPGSLASSPPPGLDGREGA